MRSTTLFISICLSFSAVGERVDAAEATATATATAFEEKLPVYGVVKPASITTLLAINHGVVVSMNQGLGDTVATNGVILEVMERETLRSYRTMISGKVAKLHVTKGAAVTPGMPLVTILDPKAKMIEVSLSAKEARAVGVGTVVVDRTNDQPFGKISKISPLVDPDTGAVTSFVEPDLSINNLIGDIIPLSLVLRKIDDCEVVSLAQIERRKADQQVEAISGTKACLKRKPAAANQVQPSQPGERSAPQ